VSSLVDSLVPDDPLMRQLGALPTPGQRTP